MTNPHDQKHQLLLLPLNKDEYIRSEALEDRLITMQPD